MRQIQRFFVVAAFLSSFVFLSSIAANAQAMTSYLFLETVDSNQKPVSDAKVDTTIYRQSYHQQTLQTDEKGQARFSGFYNGTEFLKPEFTITKPDYFPFQDFGASDNPRFRQVKVELLKIPKSKDDRKTLGDEESKREFFWALQNGDTETARKLLKSGVSPNLRLGDLRGVVGYKNIPAIIFPVVSGDGAAIKLLLEKGADIRRKDEYLSNILVYYLQADPLAKHSSATGAEQAKIMLDYDDALTALIKAGADVNANNGTPLITAVDYGRADAVKILIAIGGANINVKAYGDRTLLTLAKEHQAYYKDRPEYREIVKLLEAAGAK